MTWLDIAHHEYDISIMHPIIWSMIYVSMQILLQLYVYQNLILLLMRIRKDSKQEKSATMNMSGEL